MDKGRVYKKEYFINELKNKLSNLLDSH